MVNVKLQEQLDKAEAVEVANSIIHAFKNEDIDLIANMLKDYIRDYSHK